MRRAAKAASNKLRIIMDELLRGNDVEESQCRYPVHDDAFARGDPDDIARCSPHRTPSGDHVLSRRALSERGAK